MDSNCQGQLSMYVQSCRRHWGRAVTLTACLTLSITGVAAAPSIYRLAQGDITATPGAAEAPRRVASIDLSVLMKESAQRLEFELPSGKSMQLTRRTLHVPQAEGAQSWFGMADASDPLSDWALVTVRKGILIATLREGGATWEIRPDQHGELFMRARDPNRDTPLCGVDPASGGSVRDLDPAHLEFPISKQESFELASRWQPSRRVPTEKPDDGDATAPALDVGVTAVLVSPYGASEITTYDLLVVYTPSTLFYVGSEANLAALMQHFADYANYAYANSGVDMGVRIAGFRFINYNETGDTPADLQVFKTSPVIRTWMDETEADIATLVVTAGNFGGYAGLPARQNLRTMRAEAFSVIRWNQEALILAHEVGHNFGAQHDPAFAAPPDQAMFPFGYGYFVNGVFRTIMTYEQSCSRGCPAAPLFSTPYRTVSGYQAGIEYVYENARVLWLNSFLMANLRGPGKSTPAPKLLKKKNIRTTSVTLAWKHGTKNVEGTGVFMSDGYRWYYLGMVEPGYKSVPVNGLLPGTTYSFQVAAWRAAGGFSNPSATVSAPTKR